jgi:hypothetical protein
MKKSIIDLSHDEMRQVNGGGVSEVTAKVLNWLGGVFASYSKDPYNKTAWDMCHKE